MFISGDCRGSDRLDRRSLRARPPVRQQREQVEDADGAVAVEARILGIVEGVATMQQDRSAMPSPNGSNGRDASGRFVKGWKGGPGNPHARRVADIRSVLMSAVSDDDLRAIVSTLVEKAKAGDVMAAREVLDRLLGKAKVAVAVEPEPQRTPDEIRAAIRALVQAHPELMALAEASATP